jgi:hypothetical protein
VKIVQVGLDVYIVDKLILMAHEGSPRCLYRGQTFKEPYIRTTHGIAAGNMHGIA